MSDRYPYRHHGPAIYRSKLADYLVSEIDMIEDMRALLREAADLLAAERDGLAAGISIRGVMSDDPNDQPARDAIAEIDDWTARAAVLIGKEGRT